MKSDYPLMRKDLFNYIRHACNSMNCSLLKVAFGKNFVHLLVDMNVSAYIDGFIENLRTWTSTWIVNKDKSERETRNFWLREYLIRTVSPEEVTLVMIEMDSISEYSDIQYLVGKFNFHVHKNKFGDYGQQQETVSLCHHLILITSRSRLLLPLKFKKLLSEAMKEICSSFNVQLIENYAMRNHVHLLCNVPINNNLAKFTYEFKDKLLEWMHSNRHFRKVCGWSDDSLVFTISSNKLNDEIYLVHNQDYVHYRYRVCNEMSVLYRRLNIKYVTSLN